MRLFEMTKFPAKAGKVELTLADIRDPRRNEDRIQIPNRPQDVEFFSLKRGRQFLLTMSSGGFGGPKSVFFGGTDEEPFLTQLNAQAFDHFVSDGEAGFFESLKPPAIKAHEEAHGPERTVRQGDIFGFGLGLSWWELIDKQLTAGQKVEISSGCFRVFGTRHEVEGKVANIGRALVVEGNLTAPDHRARELAGPHLMEQAVLLNNPKMAD